MIAHLITYQGLGKNSQDIVIFGGNSAGGRGAMVHLDQIANLLKNYGIRVLGVLDSVAWLDYYPLYSEKKRGLNEIKNLYLMYSTPHILLIINANQIILKNNGDVCQANIV